MKIIIDKYTNKPFSYSKVYKHLVQDECRNLRGFINEITIYQR
jgi:hypothetical protein